MLNLKGELLSREFIDTFTGTQLRNLQKEMEVGNWLHMIGLQLNSMEIQVDVLSKLEELETYLFKVDQADCKLLNWAIQPSMIALVQQRFMEHPNNDVRHIATSCLSEITCMTAPIEAYNDDVSQESLAAYSEKFSGVT